MENKNYRGGLFSENPSSGSTGLSSNTNSNNNHHNENYGGYPVTRYGNENSPSVPQATSPSASHGNFGWKLS